MKKILAQFWFFVTGWKMVVEPDVYQQAQHSVMVAAPHTSNWDFPFTIFGFWLLEIDLKYFIKDYYANGPMGWFFRWSGALGVDRTQKNNLVEYTSTLLKNNPDLVILVPAEGTRKRVEKWRKGFYNIATQANVPISLGYCDYKTKTVGVGMIVKPTGQFETDMSVIQDFYATKHGKIPENYNKRIF